MKKRITKFPEKTKRVLFAFVVCALQALPLFAQPNDVDAAAEPQGVSDHARSPQSEEVLQLEARQQAERLRAANPQSTMAAVPATPVRIYDPAAVLQPGAGPVAAEDPVKLTPLDQSNVPADLLMTQRIRQALVAQESLSADAKNLIVITIQGRVTIRGFVENEEEKVRIENMVRTMAGDDNTVSQIEIKTKP